MGWEQFLVGFPWYEGENKFPLPAYSEFMPPMHIGFRPYDRQVYSWHFKEDDPDGFYINEVDELLHLQPGMNNIGQQCMEHLIQLGKGNLPPGITGRHNRNLKDNPFWPDELAGKAGSLNYERYVMLAPMALSKTKDDKGRSRWTFFGSSEQGPEKSFWKSFFKGQNEEYPESFFLAFMGKIFHHAFDRKTYTPEAMLEAGFRILPTNGMLPLTQWNGSILPSWTSKYLIADGDDFSDTIYLLTFRPFGNLPEIVKQKYFSGDLALIPFPGSLIPWGVKEYIDLSDTLYNAIQFPMLRLVSRNEENFGIRVPQSGWFHQSVPGNENPDILKKLILNTYVRTSRWDRKGRTDDPLLDGKEIDPIAQTLFNTTLPALDLYNKPMARNVQLLNEHRELLLDGPRAGKKEIEHAAAVVMAGGLFRYRFYFPPMHAGKHEIFWHRPVVSCVDTITSKPIVLPDLLHGYITAYDTETPDPAKPIELWPRIMERQPHVSILKHFLSEHDHYKHLTAFNLMTLLDVSEVLKTPSLEKDFARHLIRIKKDASLEEWLDILHQRTYQPGLANRARVFVKNIIRDDDTSIQPLTFGETATRKYEEDFWNSIFFLACGEYINKDNADVVQDHPTLSETKHKERDLHRLGEYLLASHRKAIAEAGMKGQAEAGELPFKWETDFDFTQFGGWKANHEGTEYERNILVIIPGKNRKEAVIMGDHYDTAYMADVYDTSQGGSGARLAAAGADDNHSATSTLLLAAPVYLKLAKEGKLERDIWLLHLTGEEFPSDCMGARNFCRNYVQKTLKMKRDDGSFIDLSGVDVKGVFVMDMIAHNRDNAKDIFQISPGRTIESIKLGYTAHLVNRTWNKRAAEWNATPERTGCKRGERVKDNLQLKNDNLKTSDPGSRIPQPGSRLPIPAKALFLPLEGEVRTWEDPTSSLYNTDVMIFSDIGVPSVLFMENYDIHRQGYHDTHDTMENIDLDYGAALSAIAIETVAQVAAEK
ncbi:MAG: M28 family peptidase [Bacteroidetes bacterium]|nr:M28 family peptidase [Bacteroidota bacterium]